MKILFVENGPLMIETTGEWTCTGEGRSTKNADRLAFCRCGASSGKPFCDGSHRRIGFIAPGGECALTPVESR